MNVTITLLFIVIPLAILLSAGLIALQIFLSLRPKAWPGLILPAFNALLLIVSIGMATLPLLNLEGFAMASRVFLIVLIPDIGSLLINLLIYWLCRNRRKTSRQQELRKMNIQDLN